MELFEIKVRNQNGTIVDLRVTEVLEIDGQPYVPKQDYDDYLQEMQNAFNQLSTKVDTLESILHAMVGSAYTQEDE